MTIKCPKRLTKLASMLTVVFVAGCPGIIPPKSPESVRDACLRMAKLFDGCPGIGFGTALQTSDVCEELSDSEHCEAISAALDCYEGIDICEIMTVQLDPTDPVFETFGQCVRDAMVLDFEAEACMSLSSFGNVSVGQE